MRLTALILLGALLLAGCRSVRAVPYKPYSNEEAGVFSRATGDVLPDAVREAPAEHADTLLAWTGVIRERLLEEEEDGIRGTFRIEHHYFDWLAGFGFGPKYILSSRGEGEFFAEWTFPHRTDFEMRGRGDEVGDMVIVYGRPVVHPEIGLFVQTEFVRWIDAKKFSAVGESYGPGETASTHEFKRR